MTPFIDPAVYAAGRRQRRLNAVALAVALLLGLAPAAGFAAATAAAMLAAR